jgi:hypothetical protein
VPNPSSIRVRRSPKRISFLTSGKDACMRTVVTASISSVIIEFAGENCERGRHELRHAIRVGTGAALANHVAPPVDLGE